MMLETMPDHKNSTAITPTSPPETREITLFDPCARAAAPVKTAFGAEVVAFCFAKDATLAIVVVVGFNVVVESVTGLLVVMNVATVVDVSLDVLLAVLDARLRIAGVVSVAVLMTAFEVVGVTATTTEVAFVLIEGVVGLLVDSKVVGLETKTAVVLTLVASSVVEVTLTNTELVDALRVVLTVELVFLEVVVIRVPSSRMMMMKSSDFTHVFFASIRTMATWVVVSVFSGVH
jgi:hypothetical protein